ncbi:MAG: hypothetical protein BWY40_01163 [bacterium ADurb.Bin270]|nr:MAG: hypothetical protein BWY40_01163 [bacterium ADurb.Bin270]
MRIPVVMGSYRKGKCVDTLVERVVGGFHAMAL